MGAGQAVKAVRVPQFSPGHPSPNPRSIQPSIACVCIAGQGTEGCPDLVVGAVAASERRFRSHYALASSRILKLARPRLPFCAPRCHSQPFPHPRPHTSASISPAEAPAARQRVVSVRRSSTWNAVLCLQDPSIKDRGWMSSLKKDPRARQICS